MKKQDDVEQEIDGELQSSSSRPERNNGQLRKSPSHSSSKRKRGKKRAGNTNGGIHQRGDKRVVR